MSIFSASDSLQLLKDWAAAFAPGGWQQDCALCGARSGTALVCPDCTRDLPRAGPGALVAAFEYRFPVDRLVQRFKHGGDLALGHWLARELAARLAQAPRPDLIVPIPLAPARLRERGFNQALEVARVLGRELRCPVAARALRRLRETPPQKGLTRAERRRNLRGAFACREPMRARRVAIVDDVYTTGATMAAAARALRAGGAASVSAWAVARTPAPGED